jgi:hypothetical protein
LCDVSATFEIVKVPLFDPDVAGIAGCECVSWCRSIFHVNADAGSIPSSASVPLPSKFNVVPAV